MQSQNSFQWVDRTQIYYIISSLAYLAYLQSIIQFNANETPVFPNFILFFVVVILMLMLTVAAQEIDHYDLSNNKLLFIHILGVIPTLVALSAIRSMMKREQNIKEEPFLMWGLHVLNVVLIITSLIYFLVLLTIILLTQDPRVIFLLYASSIGLLGISTGFLLTRLTTGDPSKESRSWIFGILRYFVGSHRSRIWLASISFVVTILLIILNGFSLFPVISV